MDSLLQGKNILVMGVRNKWSIAWGIVESAYKQGANIIITYLGERELSNAKELAASVNSDHIYQCDIGKDEDINKLFENLKENFGVLHGVVHCIANAKSEDLHSDFVYTSRDGFAHAMDISVYSMVSVCRGAKDLMTDGGSIITLTYMGSEKVFKGYNVMGVAKAALEASVRYLASDLGPMGIRVNALSAGPIKTLSAKGVANFSDILNTVEEKAPLRKGITQSELGDSALFLLSDLSRGITGEIMHVDSGFNIMGI